jgi:hypothetical protein
MSFRRYKKARRGDSNSREPRPAAPVNTNDMIFESASHTVSLKERAVRIVITRADVREFLVQYRRPLLVLAVAWVLIGGIFGYLAVTRAQTTDFYPASCLGNVGGIEQMLGKLDVGNDGTTAVFSPEHAARIMPGPVDVFCGNFIVSDQEEPNDDTQAIRKATLTIAWAQFSTSTATSTASSSPDESNVTPASESAPQGVSVEPTPESIDDEPFTATSTLDSATSTEPSSTIVATSTDATSTPSEAGTTTEPGIEGTSTATSTQPFGATSTDSGPMTFRPRRMLFGELVPLEFWRVRAAYARAPYAPGELEALQQISNASADINSADGEPEASGTDAVESAPTLFVPFDIPSTGSEPARETLSVGNFLEIDYSTDGKEWRSLGVVSDIDALTTSAYQLPLSTWADVHSLQVRISGSLAESEPRVVFIDGMRLTVESESGTSDISPQTGGNTATPPTDIIPEDRESDLDLSPKHSCTASPFSVTVSPGESAQFLVTLNPSGTSTNTYTLGVGELPTKLHGSVAASTTPNAAIIDIGTESDAPSGSYSLSLLYNEIESDGRVSRTACQYNLVVQ